MCNLQDKVWIDAETNFKQTLFCNHNIASGVECTQCTFSNAFGAYICMMCDEPLQILKDEDGVLSSDEENLDERKLGEENFPDDNSLDDEIGSNRMDVKAVNVDIKAVSTVDDKFPKYKVAPDSFEMLETAPRTHKYFKSKSLTNTSILLRAVTKNIQILKTSVPSGVWIKAYEDRIDLLSVMIEGTAGTPYENGLFIVDIHLPSNFPIKPPEAHYISYWHRRVNPNLYVDGKVCLSLLGTWPGQRREEKWGRLSTLLQLIVSIQGLVLVEEPYFNEPGTSGELGRPKGEQRSAQYNGKVIWGMIESMTALIHNSPSVFKKEILLHFAKCGTTMYERLDRQAKKVMKFLKSTIKLVLKYLCTNPFFCE